MKNEKQDNQDQNLNPEQMPVIFSYTRTQALEDGQLVDITEMAREAGFKFPVAITCGVHSLLNDIEQAGQSFKGRAWDMLMILRFEIRRATNTDTIYFSPLFNTGQHATPRPHDLWAKCGPGDAGEPVITVMLTDED